jgi:hypothetical protein
MANYNEDEWRLDLKRICLTCGVEEKQMVFFVDENKEFNIQWNEDLQSLLSNAQVPYIFTREETEGIAM